MLNSLSTGAEEDGTPRTSFANLDKRGYFCWFSFQYFAGFYDIGAVVTSMYSSTYLEIAENQTHYTKS